MVLNRVKPASDTDLERQLNRKIERRVEGFPNAKTHVLKLSDALKCVESTFNETTLIAEFVLVAAQSLIEGEQSRACGQKMFDKIEECMIEKLLSQKTARKTVRESRHGRPARGHGAGKRSIDSSL